LSSYTEKYKAHPHKPRNVNYQHQYEHENSGVNQRIAVGITKATGTMSCAYSFLLLALLGFPALSIWLGPVVAIYVVWISQTLIQLCMLPVLSVGQSVIGRKQELQADEQFSTAEKTFHDCEMIISQNNEIIQQNAEIIQRNEEQAKMLTALLTPPVTIRRKVRKQEVAE
jgi:hypothetical protein